MPLEQPSSDGRANRHICVWSADNPDEADTWSTGCGKVFLINHGESPHSSGMKFCCFCGRNLEQQI